MLYACILAAQAIDSTSLWVFVVYELGRNNKTTIKITQHKVYKRKKYFVLKSLLHVIIFATVRLSTDASSTEMANKKKTIKNKTLKEKQKQNPQSIFSLPSPSPKAL